MKSIPDNNWKVYHIDWELQNVQEVKNDQHGQEGTYERQGALLGSRGQTFSQVIPRQHDRYNIIVKKKKISITSKV